MKKPGDRLGLVKASSEIKPSLSIDDAKDLTELRLRCEILESLLVQFPMPLWVKDSIGRFVAGSDAHFELMCHPRDKVIGKTVYDFFSEADAKRFSERDAEMLADGISRDNDHWTQDKEGRNRWILTQRLRTLMPSGQYGIMSLGLDVTDRKLAEIAVLESEERLRLKNLELEEAKAKITLELDIAKALQISILPLIFPALPGCFAYARMLPATTMGGDFYDFIELQDGRIGLVMADVSGKGVPAAFFMAVALTNMRSLALHYPSPDACLTQVNNILCGQNPMEMFVTLFYGIYDAATGALSYCNGGHNRPYIRRADGSLVTLEGAGGMALGFMPDIDFEEDSVQLHPGDRLVMFTDGVTEAFNTGDEAYGEERLMAIIAKYGDATPQALVDAIFNNVIDFAGTAPQSDDITITVLECNGHL